MLHKKEVLITDSNGKKMIVDRYHFNQIIKEKIEDMKLNLFVRRILKGK